MLHILSLLIFPTLMFSFIPVEFSHASASMVLDAKKDQIKKIETDLSREKEQLLRFGIKEKSLLIQLTNIEKEISGTREFLKELKRKISLNKKELKSRQEKFRYLEYSLNEVKARLGKRLKAFYKYSKGGYVQLLATSKDLGQLRKRMKYLHIIMSEDQRFLEEKAGFEQKIKKEMSLIRERLAIINSLKKAENSKIRSIKEHLDKKVILLMKIHKEREFYETAVNELQLAAKNLKETLLNLARNERKKLLPTGFARSKGKLPLPFNGKIMKNNHPLGPEIPNIKRGIFIAGPMGAGVKAVFPGRVDFSGLIKGYGETVVINHGSRFFTISAHLSHRNREVGEMVERGDVIGLLGQADTFSGSRLYFEMRRAGINLDPLKWLKVD